MGVSRIEWTDRTWNPITGCTKRSAGCAHCYAEVMSRRLQAMGLAKYAMGFSLTLHEDCLREPFGWSGNQHVFVCSMSDIFHEGVPFEFLDRMFSVMRATPQHRYQVLTKRAERMREYCSTRVIPRNVWLGVTVEDFAAVGRIDCLRDIPASVRFLSCEPLLEGLGALDLTGIDWVIVGGESGSQARPMQESWALDIWQQTERQGACFFFKQWGTWGADGVKRDKRANGILLQGKVIQQMPEERV